PLVRSNAGYYGVTLTIILLSACGGDAGDAPPEGSAGSFAAGGKAANGGSGTTSGAQPAAQAGSGGQNNGTAGAGGTSPNPAAGQTGNGGTSAAGAGGSPGGTGGAAGGTGGAAGGSGGAAGGSTGTGGTPDDSGCTVPAVSNTPAGYGKSTTGGGNATPVVVSSFAEAEAALETYRDAFKEGTQSRLVIHYSGKFDFASITDVCGQHTKDAQILQIKEMENVTFQGTTGSSANFGIKVNKAKNVIIRNMTMGLLPGGGSSDAITLEGNDTNGDVENVWVDHNDLFSSTKDDCPGAGDTEFDGLIDIKKGARYITISYNKLHDHQKTGLLGSSDTDKTQRYVTFHNNWYDNVVSRTPLHRFGYIHLYNNYFSRITSSGINVRTGGHALIESNYFENVANPVTSRYSDEIGYWDLRNNFGSGITWTTEADTLANAETWMTTKAFPASELNYSYTAAPVACVKKVAMATAGAKL
ncbi:MAG: pectate lyase, partial [Polyangiaceae bacterium]|nr:pectate lyase [Polyangiaceae bacterium]